MCWFKKKPATDVTELKSCGLTDINTASSLMLDEVEKLGDSQAEIYLPDNEIKLYNKTDVDNFQGLEEVSSIKYIAEIHDCDDFAAEAYGKGLSLVWTNLHALNFFLDEDVTYWWVEPQNRKRSRNLEGWQGNDIRFFLAR